MEMMEPMTEPSEEKQNVRTVLRSPQLLLPLLLVCAMQGGQQLSGINAVCIKIIQSYQVFQHLIAGLLLLCFHLQIHWIQHWKRAVGKPRRWLSQLVRRILQSCSYGESQPTAFNADIVQRLRNFSVPAQHLLRFCGKFEFFSSDVRCSAFGLYSGVSDWTRSDSVLLWKW